MVRTGEEENAIGKNRNGERSAGVGARGSMVGKDGRRRARKGRNQPTESKVKRDHGNADITAVEV